MLLESRRLILRPFEREDASALLNTWTGDSQVTRYMPFFTQKTVEEAGQTINYWISLREEQFDWALIRKEDRKMVGVITCGKGLNPVAKGEIGFALGRAYWRQGYGSEAVEEVLRYQLEQRGMWRIEAFCDPDNQASQALLEKFNFQREGRLRKYSYTNLGPRDMFIYSLLREDYWRWLHEKRRL